MKNLVKSFCVLSGLFLGMEHVSAADYATFESFYSSGGLGFWGWSLIAVSAIGIGALTFFTFGGGAAAAPLGMATIGSWLAPSSLSGIAAANYGLALLGGGAVASGGLGVAGGVALLASAMSFGVDLGITYGTDVAMEKWSYSKFIESSKTMATLPPPRNEKGGRGYRTAVSYLEENFNMDKPISDPQNQHVFKRASEILSEKIDLETKKTFILKDKTMLALLYFMMNEYGKASETAHAAIGCAEELDECSSLPSFIWAASELSDPNAECTKEVVQALREAYYREPDNELIPLMTAICLDRMMYRYHYGHLSLNDLSYFCGIITNEKIDEELAAKALNIFIMRCLIEMKRTTQDIHIVSTDTSMMEQPEVAAELRKRLKRHKDLIALLYWEVLPRLQRLFKELPEDGKKAFEELPSLLWEYQENLPELEMKIQRIPQSPSTAAALPNLSSVAQVS